MEKQILTRFWVEFDNSLNNIPLGANAGIGISAYNYEDAIEIIKKDLFKNINLPAITTIIEDVDVSTLDANHVLPNVGPSNIRGIWYPKLYLY